MKKYITKIIFISSIFLILDQVVKNIVIHFIPFSSSLHIIRNFFRITYVQNKGAAWSIMVGNNLFLIGSTILILLFLGYWCFHEKKYPFLYGMLFGGILGNFIDRLCRGYVIDYFDFNFGSYQYPIFNLADIFIVISVIGFVCYSIMEEKK